MNKAKIDFENLKIIYKNSCCSCVEPSKSIKIFKSCETLQTKVHYLIKTLTKFTMGRVNLKALHRSQNCVFVKVGIGYKPDFQGKLKKIQKVILLQKIKCFTIHHFFL